MCDLIINKLNMHSTRVPALKKSSKWLVLLLNVLISFEKLVCVVVYRTPISPTLDIARLAIPEDRLIGNFIQINVKQLAGAG